MEFQIIYLSQFFIVLTIPPPLCSLTELHCSNSIFYEGIPEIEVEKCYSDPAYIML